VGEKALVGPSSAGPRQGKLRLDCTGA
jgi:hypothetical protein